MKAAVGLVALLLCARPARADPVDEAQYSHDYLACVADGGAVMNTATGMLSCTQAEGQRQQERLNRAYDAAMRRLSDAQRARLRASETAWMARRDVPCQATASEYQDLVAKLAYVSCGVDETIKRALYLERYTP